MMPNIPGTYNKRRDQTLFLIFGVGKASTSFWHSGKYFNDFKRLKVYYMSASLEPPLMLRFGRMDPIVVKGRLDQKKE